MKKFEFWLPFTFCSFISGIALLSVVINSSSWWYIPFLAFLPMCFFMAGTAMSKLNKEILQLRQKVEELKETSILK